MTSHKLTRPYLSAHECQAIRARLEEVLADLDMAGQSLAAARVASALDALEDSSQQLSCETLSQKSP